MGSTLGALTGTGSNNAGFTAQSAPIINTVNAGQLSNADAASQAALAQQGQLAQSLQGTGQQGIANESALGNALLAQSQGQGPNPAQAALNQSTGQNVANQAALMAGQRGAGANVGLIARQAGQQGAATQQAAVGQGATLQAQQQLAAQSNLANLSAAQVGQQANAVGANTAATQGQQATLLGAAGNLNNANVSNTNNMNTTNQAMAAANAKASSGAIGSLINGAAGAIPSIFAGGGGSTAVGGLMAGGAGDAGIGTTLASAAPLAVAYKGGTVNKDKTVSAPGGDPGPNKKLAKVPMKDRMPLHMQHMAHLYHGEWLNMSDGDEVPGEAKVAGDSPKNDTVPAMLSPGEAVIPRHVMESDNAPEAAKQFIMALQEKKSPEHGDFKSALEDSIKKRKKHAKS